MSSHIHHPTCKRGECCTLGNPMSAAALCRRRRWGVGTVLESIDGYGVRQQLEITAVGRNEILVATAGSNYEYQCDLSLRCWGKVKP